MTKVQEINVKDTTIHTMKVGDADYNRLTTQQKENLGAIGIFGDEAKSHDVLVGKISEKVLTKLEKKYPTLEFRYRTSINKEEINKALQGVDKELGQTLFVQDSNIKPDGGLIEVKDDTGDWRVVLVSEAKHQGKDIENIQKGIKVGVNNDQDFIVAGNAIERSHKNTSEIANLMLKEAYFPYVLFLEGSFLQNTFHVFKTAYSISHSPRIALWKSFSMTFISEQQWLQQIKSWQLNK